MSLSAARITRQPKPILRQTLEQIHRFSVNEYHRMIDAGILSPDHKVELLDGWIINKMPQKPLPSSTVQRSSDVLDSVLPIGWIVRAQFPISWKQASLSRILQSHEAKSGIFTNAIPAPRIWAWLSRSRAEAW